MPTYSADQIVGKSLIAKKPIKLYRADARTTGSSFSTIQSGSLVGVVYSWVGGAAGQPLFWQFFDNAGLSYYALHEPGAFDIKALQDQGVQTTEELKQEQAEANMSTIDKILAMVKTGGKYILIGAALYFAYNAYSKNKNKS